MEPDEVSQPDPRISVEIAGRYMLPDRSEYPCTIVEIGIAEVALVGPQDGALDEGVIVYSDPLGRIQGDISTRFPGGFGLALTGTWVALSRFADRFRRLAAQQVPALLGERRRELRLRPTQPASDAIVAYGSDMEILDLSISGAGLRTLTRPAIGSILELGQISVRVIRHFESGIAVEFVDKANDVSISERFRQITSPSDTLITGTALSGGGTSAEQILSRTGPTAAHDQT